MKNALSLRRKGIFSFFRSVYLLILDKLVPEGRGKSLKGNKHGKLMPEGRGNPSEREQTWQVGQCLITNADMVEGVNYYSLLSFYKNATSVRLRQKNMNIYRTSQRIGQSKLEYIK